MDDFIQHRSQADGTRNPGCMSLSWDLERDEIDEKNGGSFHTGSVTGRCNSPEYMRAYRIGRCISQPLGPIFPWSISPLLEQCPCLKGRRWNHLAEIFRKTYRSVLAPSWLSSGREKLPQRGVIYITPSCTGYRMVYYRNPFVPFPCVLVLCGALITLFCSIETLFVACFVTTG